VSLARPLPLFAVVVLLVNDHVLKRVIPSTVTGKLSDLAGLFFFPVLLATLARVVVPRAPVRPLAIACAASTAMVFASIKTSSLANAVANHVIGPTVLDRTDLLALPACALAALYLLRVDRVRETRRGISMGDRAAIVLAAAASAATSAIHKPPCTVTPPKPPHIGWDMTCLRTDGAHVTLSPGHLDLELRLHPAAAACVFDARALVVDYDAGGAAGSTHVRLHAPDVPTGNRVEQELVVRRGFDLPYPATCASLRVYAIVTGGTSGQPQPIEIDTKIASCTEGKP
jgi:hypothetical protein